MEVLTWLIGAIVPLTLLLWFAGRRGAARARLLREGERARATVEAIEQMGTSGDNPEVRLTLRIEPEHAAPLRARTTQTIKLIDIPRIQPGMVVEVVYDPRTEEVVVDLDGPGLLAHPSARI